MLGMAVVIYDTENEWKRDSVVTTEENMKQSARDVEK